MGEIQRILDEATEHVREMTGRDDLVVELELQPLLSPEKTEKKKWPDDFRGFGSNVQPKKRRGQSA